MSRPDPELRGLIVSHLRSHHPDMCRAWFDAIEPVDLTNGVLKLCVREPVQLKYLQRCCVEPFTEAAQASTGLLVAVRFVSLLLLVSLPGPYIVHISQSGSGQVTFTLFLL